VGTDYGFQPITAVGVTNPIFSLDGGALPDGLLLDPTGIIFGTPTAPGTFNFTLGVTEAGTGLTCEAAASITITAGGLHFNNLVWSPPTIHHAGSSSASQNHGTANASDATDFSSSSTHQQGTLTYTGPLVNCNLQITPVFADGASSGLTAGADISQDAVPIATLSKTSPPDGGGTFNLPFTVAAGVNSVILVEFAVTASANDHTSPCSVSLSFNVTPA